jgi:hypothetical protein
MDDPLITDMDPVQKMWMFNQWLGDKEEQADLAKNHAYLLASFWNPEAVQDILGTGGNVHASTEEEFEESSQIVKEGSLKMLEALKQVEPATNGRRRRRRTLKQD